MKTNKVRPRLVIEVRGYPWSTGAESDMLDLEELKDDLIRRNYLSMHRGFVGRVAYDTEYQCEACDGVYGAGERELVGLECEGCGAELCHDCLWPGENQESLCKGCYREQQDRIAGTGTEEAR
jgi:hypothetical protein